MRRFYVTTPIYYVNDVPHLGTAYTTVVADALRRFHALDGADARMLTGTDEHGLKLERVAKERGIAPKEFVDGMSAPFREAWPKLDVAADDFIRTTETRHQTWVQDLWQKVAANGYLTLGNYEDWYCVGCESFKTEKELEPGNICPLHKKPVERVKEETFFFQLSKFEKPLLDFYASHPDFIQPEGRRNEVLSFVEAGLKDLSVSRTSFSWGIPVPGHPNHVMYVWFDALANYRSALQGADSYGDLARFWPPYAGGESVTEGRVLHLVGKDILRFHAIFWPAFLLAAGYTTDQLPTQVFAHGFLTVDGQKMSKSLRNAVNPVRLAEKLGADAVRYQLLRAIAFGQDGDFDHGALLERYNADLGKNLGNLLNRVIGLTVKNFDGKVPARGASTPLENELASEVAKLTEAAKAAWFAVEPHRALEHTFAIAALGNQYIDRTAPWALAKSTTPEDRARFGTVLATLFALLEALSRLIGPAMPTKAAAMRHQLGLEAIVPTHGESQVPSGLGTLAEGTILRPEGALFPTYDKDQVKALLDELVPPKEAPVTEEKPAPSASEATPSVAPITAAVPTLDEGLPAVDYDTFAKTDLRVGLISHAEKVPRKDKLLRLEVDLGEGKPRQIVAGLALTFKPEDLVGRRVLVVGNLAPRDFGKGLISHGMILASGPSEALVLPTIDASVAPGARLK
jgi:methionyl-tRNA synthetase